MKRVGLPEEKVIPYEDGVPVLVEELEGSQTAPAQEAEPART